MTSNRFNEAAAFQLRNPHEVGYIFPTFEASMRPQRFSCGIHEVYVHHKRDGDRFNEAAAFQLRNQGMGGAGKLAWPLQ